MLARLSKKEITLLGGIVVYIIATLGLLIWGALAIKSAMFLLGAIYSPLLWLVVISFVLLLRRSEMGAWRALIFFALQGVKFEKEGALVWPPVTSVGINIELVHNATYALELGISSIFMAIIAVAVIVQLSEEKALAAMPEVAPLLPPNKSFERTRER
jgi:hypothetical protein